MMLKIRKNFIILVICKNISMIFIKRRLLVARAFVLITGDKQQTSTKKLVLRYSLKEERAF